MNIEVKNSLKLVDYNESMKILEKRVNDVFLGNKKELLWVLEHSTVYTAGSSSREEDVLNKNIKIIKTNRGGKTTYHGPGQRIVYFVINLNKRKKDIRKFINIIEKSLMDFLSIYNIDCSTYKNRVGIWVIGKNGNKFAKEEKIGAIGLRLKNWITYHGLSFNIKPDLENYDYINACGLENFKNTSLKELGLEIKENKFDEEYAKIFLNNLKDLK